eukprot:7380852-Prymnesium_polylepis.1
MAPAALCCLLLLGCVDALLLPSTPRARCPRMAGGGNNGAAGTAAGGGGDLSGGGDAERNAQLVRPCVTRM